MKRTALILAPALILASTSAQAFMPHVTLNSDTVHHAFFDREDRQRLWGNVRDAFDGDRYRDSDDRSDGDYSRWDRDDYARWDRDNYERDDRNWSRSNDDRSWSDDRDDRNWGGDDGGWSRDSGDDGWDGDSDHGGYDD